MNVAMATASNFVQMFLDPIPAPATLVLPSTRMEGLAKVCEESDLLNTVQNTRRCLLRSLTADVVSGCSRSWSPCAHPRCLQKPAVQTEGYGKHLKKCSEYR